MVDHVIHPDFCIRKLYEEKERCEKASIVHMSKNLWKQDTKHKFLLHRLLANQNKLEIFDVEISDTSAQVSLCNSLRACTFLPLYGIFSRNQNYLFKEETSQAECELLVMDVDKNIILFSGSGKTKLFRCLFQEVRALQAN